MIFSIIISLIIIIFVVSVLVSTMYSYEFAEAGIIVKVLFALFFKVELVRLKFILIKEISIIPSWKVIPLMFIPFVGFGLKWWHKEIILIKLKSGPIRLAILTPDNPREFVSSMKDKLIQKTVLKIPMPA
jgi:hypothetical protein